MEREEVREEVLKIIREKLYIRTQQVYGRVKIALLLENPDGHCPEILSEDYFDLDM